MIGPLTIKREVNAVTFELCLPDYLRIHPGFHVSLLERYIENNIENRPQHNPPPLMIDDENQPLYEVGNCYRLEDIPESATRLR